jgi:hypothetical protein
VKPTWKLLNNQWVKRKAVRYPVTSSTAISLSSPITTTSNSSTVTVTYYTHIRYGPVVSKRAGNGK